MVTQENMQEAYEDAMRECPEESFARFFMTYIYREYKKLKIEKEEKVKKKTIIAYLDGDKLVDVVQAALDNNMTVNEVKKKLIQENPGHEVVFIVEVKK